METDNNSSVQGHSELAQIVAKHVAQIEPVLMYLEKSQDKNRALIYMIIDVRISLDELKNAYFANEDVLLKKVENLGASVDAFAETIDRRIERRGTEIKKSNWRLIHKCSLKMQQLKLVKIASKTNKMAAIYKSLTSSIEALNDENLDEQQIQIDE